MSNLFKGQKSRTQKRRGVSIKKGKRLNKQIADVSVNPGPIIIEKTEIRKSDKSQM
jgi:hypothetical protein